MNKILYLFLSLYFISPLISISQTDKYLVLVNKYCDEIKPENYKDLNPNEIPSQLIKLGNEASIKYQSDINEIMVFIQKEFPNKTQNELLIEYSRRFMFYSIEYCPAYLNLIMIPYGKCPKDNKTLMMIRNEADQYLNKHADLSYIDLYESTVNHLSQFIFQNRILIEKDYQDGLSNPQFTNDMVSYLFYKSKNFLITSLSAQIENSIKNK